MDLPSVATRNSTTIQAEEAAEKASLPMLAWHSSSLTSFLAKVFGKVFFTLMRRPAPRDHSGIRALPSVHVLLYARHAVTLSSTVETQFPAAWLPILYFGGHDCHKGDL
jgi:hypothetical protein